MDILRLLMELFRIKELIRTLQDFGLYPFHMQAVQTLQSTDYTAGNKFCHWILGNQQLHMKILFTQKATFNRNGMTNTLNSHIW